MSRTQGPVLRTVAELPTLQHVPHFGYVSLFPFLMKLLPSDSRQLGATLQHMTDPTLLWTEFGLRCVAAACVRRCARPLCAALSS